MNVSEYFIYVAWIIAGIYYLLKDKHSNKISLKNWPHIRNLLVGIFLILSGLSMLIAFSISGQAQDKINDLIFCLFGLYSAIDFRYVGKESLIQRKKFNEFLGWKLNYDNSDILLNQIMFLLIGTLFFITGLAKLFS